MINIDNIGLILRPDILKAPATNTKMERLKRDRQLFKLCCEEGSLVSVKAILRKHPEFLNEPDQHGISPLLCAVKQQRLDIATFLHSKGADINAKNKAGQSPLFWAAANNNLQGTKHLLHLGAAVNIPDKVSPSTQ